MEKRGIIKAVGVQSPQNQKGTTLSQLQYKGVLFIEFEDGSQVNIPEHEVTLKW